MHHDTVVADLPMHDEVNAVERRQELSNELSDGFSTFYRGRRWDVAVYTASSVKQLAISSRSGLDHSAQNLVTTSSGEPIMPR